jgi:signal transduction histidine kinase
LGTPAAEIFPEAWPFIGPLFESTRQGESVALDDMLIPLDRNGYLENCYFTLSYSPIRDESGGVGGMLAVVAETTARLEGERRLKTLRELARQSAEVKTIAQACESAVGTLAEDPIDVPFALLYLVGGDGRSALLVASTGIADNSKAYVPLIDLSRTDAAWPIAEVAESRKVRIMDDLPQRFGPLPGGPYPEAAHTAVIAPLARPGQPQPDGVVVFGVSPRRALDDSYRGFYDLAADHILSAIRNAVAFQEERQRAEALAELDRTKTAFFSNVSHEFRTPLTLMLGPLEDLLEVRSTLSGEIRGHVEVAYRNSLRLLKLVNTMLDFSRIEAGRMDAVYEPVDLPAYTSELASVFRSTIEKQGLRYIVTCRQRTRRFTWIGKCGRRSYSTFSQTHSSSPSKERSKSVSGLSSEHSVELFVRDTGTGIQAEEIPHLFERFHRVKSARGRSYEGTGIGLALVQELSRLHGGSADVASELEKGSTFTVTIPLGHSHLPADRVGASRQRVSTGLGGEAYLEEALRWVPQEDDGLREAPEVAQHSKTDRRRILLADDNADMRHYVSRLFSQRFSVTSVADGMAALEVARKERPDLILSDIMMTGLDGFGLLHAIRMDPDLRTIPVILLSARAGEEARVEGLAAGADDYLVKPFSARELMARVEAHLEMTKIRRESELTIRGLYEAAQKARSDAETANRLKDEFLATVSHELRTPLNAILGWTRLLRTGRLDEQRKQQAVEIVERNAIAQQQIVEDILDVSRIITGKLRLEVAPVDLGPIVEAAVDSMKPSADAKGVRLQSIVDSGANIVLGDPNRLQQIVWNLLSNAVKFTSRGGRVQVALERKASHSEVTVRDTGKGISQDFLPYVFERFRQADSSSTRKYGGLGLGLAIVRHLTELNGGSVEAFSPGENQGATFTVRLPLAIIHDKSTPVRNTQPVFPGISAAESADAPQPAA